MSLSAGQKKGPEALHSMFLLNWSPVVFSRTRGSHSRLFMFYGPDSVSIQNQPGQACLFSHGPLRLTILMVKFKPVRILREKRLGLFM